MTVLNSCKKEQLEIPTAEKPNNCYSPNTNGSYWIYDWLKVDTNGVETTLPFKDTIRVIGDTTINGNVYTITRGTSMDSNIRNFYNRDSSGYLVNSLGDIMYSYNNFTDTIQKRVYAELWDSSLKMYNNVQVSVPAGTFNSIEARRYHYYSNGAPANNCGDPYFTLSTWFVQGVGKIKGTTAYINELMNCGFIMEQRLVEYYIAP